MTTPLCGESNTIGNDTRDKSAAPLAGRMTTHALLRDTQMPADESVVRFATSALLFSGVTIKNFFRVRMTADRSKSLPSKLTNPCCFIY
ncbi:hypothetical protein [Pandoraea sputorum]|uniref:hypothetical protein n=1 Tax=Pandoraea sputorum TaxID=93222 RepID=UPI001474D622|nr:hypothetical protein [Pandoraea sputorum]